MGRAAAVSFGPRLGLPMGVGGCQIQRRDRQLRRPLVCCFHRVGKSRNKVIALPKLAVLAVYKLPRFLDCFSLVGTFDALDARKVSIIAKGVDAILVHELHSASCNAQAGALWVSQPPTPGAGPRSVME